MLTFQVVGTWEICGRKYVRIYIYFEKPNGASINKICKECHLVGQSCLHANTTVLYQMFAANIRWIPCRTRRGRQEHKTYANKINIKSTNYKPWNPMKYTWINEEYRNPVSNFNTENWISIFCAKLIEILDSNSVHSSAELLPTFELESIIN